MGIAIGSDPIYHEKGELHAPDEVGVKTIATREWVAEQGGSGGGVEILSASRTLTDEQIKALPTTGGGVEVVAAPGVGKMIVPISAYAILDSTAGAYSDTTDASLGLVCNSNFMSSLTKWGSSLSDNKKSYIPFLVPYSENGTGTFADNVVTYSKTDAPTQLENQPISVVDSWGGIPDYTGGNAANTLKVTVYYIEVTL